MSVLEDIQCCYSLATTRLLNLLSQIELPATHTQYYLKRRRGGAADDDNGIQQAYADCMQLQQQMNIARHAINRLQHAIHLPSYATSDDVSPLQHASVDKLRVLAELLLDSLLTITYPTPTIPQLPSAIYSVFTRGRCEALFKNLCVNGTRKMQLYGGILLVRLCGNYSWWGDFLGNIIHELFSFEQQLIFPQDR